MNITFINSSIGYGGAAKMMMVVARGLQSLGHTVSVVNLNTNNVPVSQKIDGIQVITADISCKSGLRGNYKYVSFTIKAARELKSNILIGFKELSNFCAVLAGWRLHIPSIISERGDPYVAFRNKKLLLSMKLFCINHATGAIFQTKGASEFYSKHLQDNCAIIPNAILIDQEIPSYDYNNRPKTVVSLGRFDNKQKRLDILVKAFALFHQTHPDHTLVIYGSGEDKDKLKKFIAENQVEPFVRLMGISRNSLQDLSNEGMFVISSDYEGISNALLEAMAVGLPVVSTDHSPGGARLLISDHENGLLTPMRDPKAIAVAMSEFADNPELAVKCGQNAKKVLERFNVEDTIRNWNEYIISVVKRYGR